MPTIRKRQDWAMFIQILQQCKVCYAYTKKPLAFYCVRKKLCFQKKDTTHTLQRSGIRNHSEIQ